MFVGPVLVMNKVRLKCTQGKIREFCDFCFGCGRFISLIQVMNKAGLKESQGKIRDFL